MYTCNIRLILEYAAQVWQGTPVYLSDTVESIQRRCLRIIIMSKLWLSISARSRPLVECKIFL